MKNSFIRMKTNLEEDSIKDRLRYNPEIIEFYLYEKDLHNLELLRSRIRFLKEKGIKVYLHHPDRHNGKYLDIISEDNDIRNFYDWSSQVLAKICSEEDVYCVIHAHYDKSECSIISSENVRKVKDRINYICSLEGGDRFLWEDTIEGVFSYSNELLFDEIIQPLNLHLNVDISHVFISQNGSNEKLIEVLEKTKNYAKYYHVVDSKGLEHDSLTLGEGLINWENVKPYVMDKDFIFEIGLKPPYIDGKPMYDSAVFFKKISSTKNK